MAQPPKPRIMWSAKDDPRITSGYGIMGKNLLPRFAKHYGPENVLIFAPIYNRDFIQEWEGMKILPGVAGSEPYSEDILLNHYQHYNCTFLLQVGDWAPLRQVPAMAAADRLLWVQWAPLDFLSWPENMTDFLSKAWRVVPWIQWAEKQFKGHDLKNVTAPIPLGIDEKVWHPYERSELGPTMRSCGFTDDTFNIVMVTANQHRKYIMEQLQGIGIFQEANPEVQVQLYYHGSAGGERDITDDLKAVGLWGKGQHRFIDPYVTATGGATEEQMAKIFSSADVVLNTAFEGFGLSIIQAQSVGKPVICMNLGAGEELAVWGAMVPPDHVDYRDNLQKPVATPLTIAESLTAIYKKQAADGRTVSQMAINHVLRRFTWDKVAAQWFDLIDELMEERERLSLYIPEPSKNLRRKARITVEARQ